jgi:hypothetical protein
VTNMGDKRGAYRVLVGKRRRRQNNIKMYIQEVGGEALQDGPRSG